MFQECAFDVETLDQIRAPAKRAVEKLPVSPFHLEMAASSTRAGELGLESQGLLAENSETPRFCPARQDVVPLLLLYFIALALSGMWQWFTGLEGGHIRSGAYFFVSGSGLEIFRICPWSCSVL